MGESHRIGCCFFPIALSRQQPPQLTQPLPQAAKGFEQPPPSPLRNADRDVGELLFLLMELLVPVRAVHDEVHPAIPQGNADDDQSYENQDHFRPSFLKKGMGESPQGYFLDLPTSQSLTRPLTASLSFPSLSQSPSTLRIAQ